MSLHEDFSHLEVFGAAVDGRTRRRQTAQTGLKENKKATDNQDVSKEKMPGELKRWFLVLLRGRRQRTFDQLAAFLGVHTQSVRSVLIDVDEKNTIRKSNASEVLSELARIQHAELCKIPGAISHLQLS